MAPFIHHVDTTDETQILKHFQDIPDITEYILESRLYPLALLQESLDTLQHVAEHIPDNSEEAKQYARTMTKIESVISTRVDYVSSIIDNLLGNDSFSIQNFSLEDSPTKEILSHIDLMKDVAASPEIKENDYKAALKKFIKTLKYRFNKSLEIHKDLRNLEFEALAERKEDFPHEELQEHKSFLEDALDMTRTHVPVKPIQIRHLKETLFKILEAMGIRVLQKNGAEVRADYFNILQEIESLIVGMEIDFGQKIASRFTDMLPEYIADHWNFNIIKHNRKLVSLLIDCMDDPTLLNDLYHILNNLVSAEAIQIQRKQELSAKITLKDAEHFEYVKNEEHAQQIQIESFKTLGIPEKARELIKLSVYGLCDYICKISIEELSKYPIGIIKSAEKMLKDLGQHKLKESEEQSLQDIPEYIEAVSIIDQALSGYNSNEEKYNFADIYKETDFTVDGISYCAFNDIILREIQNIMEADLVVDPSSDGNLSNNRMTELHVTIAERYRTEWIRQNDMRQQSEQEAMQELAAELL